MNHHHFLIISLAAQSHLNPTLQLAKILARKGVRATFTTTVSGLRRLKNLPIHEGLHFASFSDGQDEATEWDNDFTTYMAKLNQVAPGSLKSLLTKLANEGYPVTYIVYTLMLPWAAKVAREVHVPSAFLVIQCAASFAFYHRFFNSHDGVFGKKVSSYEPSFSIEFPGLPLFSCNEIPTFLFTGDPLYSINTPHFQEHIKVLEQESKPCVLINTFDELEHQILKSFNDVNVIPIGPFIPSAFSDGIDTSDNSFGCELIESKEDSLEWLDTQEEKSVIYVSFGSFVQMKKEEEEILQCLIEIDKPFLLVIRSSLDDDEGVKGMLQKGLIVQWCSQVEVLAHKAIGCFVSHCGWNSIMESIVAGVPIVGYPHYSDQPTNAKLVEEVWCNGVRARPNNEGVVERKEMRRCLDIVMGSEEEGERIRGNALKWRNSALEAVRDEGSSFKNLNMFLANQ
ncbi:transferase [Lithospermum erythrorhizon]|uniref:Glycosyltransferase n=1 Tax=Lithospermum erythrorhizon TaxID=34254 RepID=A0AAV3PLB9_LITER